MQHVIKLWAIVVLCVAAAAPAPAFAANAEEDALIARSLTEMLRAARAVVSRNQELINDPTVWEKGLTGKKVLAEANAIFTRNTQIDPAALAPDSRHGRLLRAQQDAIVEVIDAHQTLINQKGVGFKGFIPSTFGRLLSEAFAKRAANDAVLKVTAPDPLIRNRKSRPDEWEAKVIREKLMASSWPKGQMVSEVATSGGKPASRYASPEYYGASCLSCHGGPKGQIDVTGYPKEGAEQGDLGGVISVTLFH